VRPVIDIRVENILLYENKNSKEMYIMTRKTIDASREVRLWIGQIIIPAMTLAATTMAIPEVRQAVAAKANSVKQSIEKKFKKEEP
jgi:hypothetical protein